MDSWTKLSELLAIDDDGGNGVWHLRWEKTKKTLVRRMMALVDASLESFSLWKDAAHDYHCLHMEMKANGSRDRWKVAALSSARTMMMIMIMMDGFLLRALHDLFLERQRRKKIEMQEGEEDHYDQLLLPVSRP